MCNEIFKCSFYFKSLAYWINYGIACITVRVVSHYYTHILQSYLPYLESPPVTTLKRKTVYFKNQVSQTIFTCLKFPIWFFRGRSQMTAIMKKSGRWRPQSEPSTCDQGSSNSKGSPVRCQSVVNCNMLQHSRIPCTHTLYCQSGYIMFICSLVMGLIPLFLYRGNLPLWVA